MVTVISQFFAHAGYPLRNPLWSWGARSGNGILLRAWDDEYAFKERKLRVLDFAAPRQPSESFGLDERIVHLEALWDGGVAGYAVIATAKDKDASPRQILAYREDGVFALTRLEQNLNGDLIALVGELVPVSALARHSQTHRTAPGEGVFPVDDVRRSGLSTDSYKEKIPAIRAWLIEVCHARGTVTYSDVMQRFALTFYPLRNAMSRLGHECKGAGEPVLTALIVDKNTRRCSQGLFDEFQIDDDELERARCYAYWARTIDGAPVVPESATNAAGSKGQVDDFQRRAARFAQVEIRPDQSAFRDAVFRAFDGRCAVSGCSIPEALEAAHLAGRDWRQGYNRATDGILLRRDLHTLYDRGLLHISDAGQVKLSADVLPYYAEFDGRSVVEVNTSSPAKIP